MSNVYLLQHVAIHDDDEDVKVLGIYTTAEEAEKAIARFVALDGFKDHPDGFSVDEYSMNEDSWVSGFASLTQVFMPLLGEGTTVWRPVWASHVDADIYRIETENPDSNDETWKFGTGQLVRCEVKKFDDARGLIAVEALDESA